MDLEMENRIATILMKEAAELRRQAEKEGVHVYLRQPQLRGRPNSRFLTATVLGVQQANQAVEVNEMWCIRQKELELDNRLKGRLGDGSSTGRRLRDMSDSRGITSKRVKRGRGAVGSQMDETEPHLSSCPNYKAKQLAGHDEWGREEWEHRDILSPEKPSLLKPCECSEEESIQDKWKKAEKEIVVSSKRHSRKHRSIEKSINKKKKKRKEEKKL